MQAVRRNEITQSAGDLSWEDKSVYGRVEGDEHLSPPCSGQSPPARHSLTHENNRDR